MAKQRKPEQPTKLALVTELLEERTDAITAALGDVIDPRAFIQVALMAVERDNQIRRCSIESIYLALMDAAACGLLPDRIEGVIVKYKGQAVFMPMVRGLIRAMLRCRDVGKVEAKARREGDDWEIEYGTEQRLRHVPKNIGTSKSFDPSVEGAWMMVWWLNGAPPTFVDVTRVDVEKARRTSRAPQSGAWKTWYDQMACKVAIHRGSKYVDLNARARLAIELDQAAMGFDVETLNPRAETAASAKDATDATLERMERDAAERKAGTPFEAGFSSHWVEPKERGEIPATYGFWNGSPGWYVPYRLNQPPDASGTPEDRGDAPVPLPEGRRALRLPEALELVRSVIAGGAPRTKRMVGQEIRDEMMSAGVGEDGVRDAVQDLATYQFRNVDIVPKGEGGKVDVDALTLENLELLLASAMKYREEWEDQEQ